MRHGPDSGHPDGCFGCRVKTVGFAAAAMPTRRAEVNRIERTEASWDVDGEAYKRLRADGVQPHGIDGSAALETLANSKEEIEAWKQAG